MLPPYLRRSELNTTYPIGSVPLASDRLDPNSKTLRSASFHLNSLLFRSLSGYCFLIFLFGFLIFFGLSLSFLKNASQETFKIELTGSTALSMGSPEQKSFSQYMVQPLRMQQKEQSPTITQSDNNNNNNNGQNEMNSRNLLGNEASFLLQQLQRSRAGTLCHECFNRR